MIDETAFRSAVPPIDGRMRVRGLEGRVEILRDPLGVPHVRAQTLHDAFFAQGFVHAQDRLWQMDFNRRHAAGRLAEILGPAALTLDVFVRRIGIAAVARAEYAAVDAATRGMLDAYTAGINAFIEATPRLPIEFTLLGLAPEPWEPWQSAATLKIRHVLMGTFDIKLWRARLLEALGPELLAAFGGGGREELLIVPPGGRAAVRPAPEDLAPGLLAAAALRGESNSWVLSGTRTHSGRPLLAGDSHRALEVPNVYYQNHFSCPAFDAIGLSMPGVPGMFHFGHNQHVAWCVTHAMADTQDLYVERFDADGRCEHRGRWETPERRVERIGVRGAAPVEITVTATRHGPVLFGDAARGTAIALRWTGTDAPNTTLRALAPMLAAGSVEELDGLMRDWVDPCNNFLMADVHGTIGYLHRGRVPRRPRANGRAPVPGWTGEHEWVGEIPFEELPRLRDPEEGFIVTANNRVCGDDYPHYLATDYSSPNRAERVLGRLGGLEAATVSDMAAIHSDTLSLDARRMIETVRRVRARDGATARVGALLDGWDGRMEPSAVAPAVYATLRDEIAALLCEREPLARAVPNPFPEEPMPTPAVTRIRAAVPRLLASEAAAEAIAGGDWAALVRDASERSLGLLAQTLGPDPAGWQWGRLHRTSVTHPLSHAFPEAADRLDPPPVSMGGDRDTVLASTAELGYGIEHTSVARYVFDLGDWDQSAWIIPLGASGHPGSPHYADQAETWARAELRPMRYRWDRIEEEAETRQRLAP